jgi:exportin-1
VAEAALKAFQEHPQSWTRVDAILEQAKSEQTKFYALQVSCHAFILARIPPGERGHGKRLTPSPPHNQPPTKKPDKQILESVIKYKWGALPQEQREGIKTYLSNLIIASCADDALFRQQATFLKKLDVALVQVLKHDWPARWPSFVPDLVAASKTSEPLCENSMHILRLLSEEVFDFSRGELTQAKTRELKNSLNQQFTLIHDLCLFVLANTRRQELVKATLSALAAYLSWVPAGYIFEGSVVQHLLALFPQAAFRNTALQCLTEVAGLSLGPEADAPFVSLYGAFMTQLAQILPPGTDIASAYERGTDEQQAFVQNLALFLTAFLRAHLRALEAAPGAEVRQALLAGLELLVAISYVDDTEVFKTCLEYWNYFVPDVYASVSIAGGGSTAAAASGAPAFAFASAANGNGNPSSENSPPTGAARRQLYSTVLSKLRALMIARMAKPEEVIVVEDESGAIVRETMKDNDVLAQYRSMRETLIYLAHLDHEDTEAQMLERLRGQLAGGPGAWTWQGLNTLCWAIGSVSGSMAEDQENRFLVTVIRDLLNLCEVTRGKDNKAVIASNIM